MNREEYLQQTFPLPDGTTYIQSLDKHLSVGIDFWYTNIKPFTGIRDAIQKINKTIFKDVDSDPIDSSRINFLVFTLETEWTNFQTQPLTQSNEFINLLIDLQDKNFYFIADNSGCAEHRVDNISLNFHILLARNNFNFDRLIIANNDSSRIGYHRVRYGSYTMNTCFFPNFYMSTYNQLKQYVTELNPNLTPDKTFLCLNRRMNNDKYKMVEHLYNRGLLNDTRLTWVGNYTDKEILNPNLIKELNIDPFKPIQLEDDIIYGNELTDDQYLYTINPTWYYKSKVNIITEAMLYPNLIHITEKTWKAIYLGVPFVIYAPSKHYLKTLRDMGFKTFNSVINEDYDEMTGYNKIEHIVNAAIELSKIYNTHEVLSICRYNQKLYHNNREQIYKDSFLNHLYDINKLSQPINKTQII
jgi:hypothetical protein